MKVLLGGFVVWVLGLAQGLACARPVLCLELHLSPCSLASWTQLEARREAYTCRGSLPSSTKQRPGLCCSLTSHLVHNVFLTCSSYDFESVPSWSDTFGCLLSAGLSGAGGLPCDSPGVSIFLFLVSLGLMLIIYCWHFVFFHIIHFY